MPGEIKESDWRIFKQLHAIALERYFMRAVADVERVLGEKEKSSRDRFWDAHKLMDEHRETLNRTFDDYRRSTALMQLEIIREMDLLRDNEVARFSAEVKEYLRTLAEIRERHRKSP